MLDLFELSCRTNESNGDDTVQSDDTNLIER